MKISANYTIFYGADFIEYSMRSIYDRVDYILIALGEKSWPNVHGQRLLSRIDNVKEKIEHFIKHEDKDNKVRLYEGVWQSDTEQRNFVFDKSRELECDFVFVVDSDEVWDTPELDTLFECLSFNEKFQTGVDLYTCNIKHYYRTLHSCFWDKTAVVNILARVTPKVKHYWIRHFGDNIKTFSIPDCFYHHFGYAYPSKLIKEKVKYWGHNAEVVENWFDIFMRWKPGKLAIAPTGQDWSDIMPSKLPKVMENHPFNKYKIIP